MGDAMSDSCYCTHGRDPECPRHGESPYRRRQREESEREAARLRSMTPLERVQEGARGDIAAARGTASRPTTLIVNISVYASSEVGPFGLRLWEANTDYGGGGLRSTASDAKGAVLSIKESVLRELSLKDDIPDEIRFVTEGP